MKTNPTIPKPPKTHFQCTIGGKAGAGVMVIGQMFSRLCVRSGRWTFDYPEYPSLISGGHNVYQVLVSDDPIHAPVRGIQLLIALNQETIDLHRADLTEGAGIVYDPDAPGLTVADLENDGFRLFPVPMEKLAKDLGSERSRNVIALAVCAGLVNADKELLNDVIRDTFKDKSKELVAQDLAAARLGYAFAEEHFSAHVPLVLKPHAGRKKISMTGNTAIALGAIQAGCKLYTAYPMTPATSILSYLAKVGPRIGMVVRHAEDEIGVINCAIGAAYAGVRSMIGTSGGGFSLMVEGLGLAGMLEVPIVIINGQRPGPSTGLPTWTEQGDLQFVLRASQGDFPRIVLAPGDVDECFYLTFQAFNLAEHYQLPVILLTDKFLGESAMAVEPFSTGQLRFDRGAVDFHPMEAANGMYPRYRFSPNGISPRVFPGTVGGIHVANSDEHNEYGIADESAENRVAMMKKRMQKLAEAAAAMPLPMLYGQKQAELTLLTWGSTKGPALDALALLEKDHQSVNMLHFSSIFPLPVQKLEQLFRHCTNTMVIEGNATGQFAQLLKQEVGLIPESVYCKYDGRPFFAEEIAAEVKQFFARA